MEEREASVVTYEGVLKNGGVIDGKVGPKIFQHGYSNYFEGMTGADSIKNRAFACP